MYKNECKNEYGRKRTCLVVTASILCLAVIVVFALCFSVSGYAFSDVSEGDWFAENVNAMTSVGLIEGYEDGRFRPNDTITRAEFVSIVCRAADVGVSDSESGHWASEYMKYAYEQGWYDYDEIVEADYDIPITRPLAVKVLVLALDVPKNEYEDNAYYKYMTSIVDFDLIPGRYATYVVRAYNNGILLGYADGKFRPNGSLTRAEACAVISRALDVMGGISSEPAVSSTAEPTAAPSVSGTASENGKLSVVGTTLRNENGEAMVLSGMSSHGIQWYSNFTSYESIRNTANFGANVFRVAMYTAEGGYIENPESVKNAAFNAVDNAIRNDMYVILDWHILSDGDPMQYVSEAEAFFAEASERYADVPNVIYEICNEPNGDITWSGNVKPYAERIIPIIRENTDAVILVGSPTWSRDVDAAADDPLEYSNIMYTCHFYAGTHGSALRDKIDYALSKGAPIFVSEWGTSAADGNGGVYLSEASEWMNFLDERGISRVNWSLCDKSESSAALVPGTDSSAVWTIDDLTDSGRFVFGVGD